MDSSESHPPQECISMDSDICEEGTDQNMDFMDTDEGAENLDVMISIIEEQEKLQEEVLALGDAFVKDVQEQEKWILNTSLD